MTDVHFTGPGETETAGACLICLMICKAAELAANPEWRNLAGDDEPGQHWYPWQPGPLPLVRAAVVDGISDVMPQAGLIPLCWDHLGAIEVTRPSTLLRGADIPPGLLRGKG